MGPKKKKFKETRAVQMGTSPQRDEELRSVGVWATVGHAQQPVIGDGGNSPTIFFFQR